MRSNVNGRVSETRFHYAGGFWIAISNTGRFGDYYSQMPVRDHKDLNVMGIQYWPSFEFPAGTKNEYLASAGLWFGGIVGTDTLVSMTIGAWGAGADEMVSFDTITEVSASPGSPYYAEGFKTAPPPCTTLGVRNAYADQQYFARYTDTVVGESRDQMDNRPHKPLGLVVSQTSYVWADRSARDFVIVQLWVRNVSTKPISKFAFGILMDADVLNTESAGSWGMDDISGLIDKWPNVRCTEFKDPMWVAWTADNDGDPQEGVFRRGSPSSAIGARLLDAPPVVGSSYNWWTWSPNWGPARNFQGDPIGTPVGDRACYRMMTNQSVDYGQTFVGLDYTNQGWQRIRPELGCSVANGTDTRFLLSAGPMLEDLSPGDSVLFAFAIVAGERFHSDPAQMFDCHDPKDFLNQKGLGGIASVARMAGWVYDAPNVDSDCDGHRGEAYFCAKEMKIITIEGRNYVTYVYHDTAYYQGDMGSQPSRAPRRGAPDLSGPKPPPCPGEASGDLSFETQPGKIIVRWSGRSTELVKDPMLGTRDFEGYNVYISPRNDPNSYSLVASWDVENYKRWWYYHWHDQWRTNDSVYSVADIRQIVGDPTFEPSRYTTRSRELCFVDTLYNQWGDPQVWRSYFEPYGSNNGNIIRGDCREWTNKIQRVRLDTVVVDGDTLAYGAYELVLDHLQPSMGQYVSLTVFDRGEKAIGLASTETRPGSCFIYAVPIYSADVVEAQGLKVGVYPNPYKSSFIGEDGRLTNYYVRREEAPQKNGESGKFVEQDRRIHFINLPDTATISIYTLSGDLVRTIEHPDKYLSTYSSESSWDLVSRNAQAVVSGIYIWRVTSKLGSQVGKIVIIK
ncbi:MAG: T9SS type A sorting domain-containing protein [candidate division Zixibacteria bacterium]|nr:T9SS type A sorting domain-containing protein [candidate division Zixibacteria bacterium]